MAESNIMLTDTSRLPTQPFEGEQHGWSAYKVIGHTASKYAELGFEAGLRSAQNLVQLDSAVAIVLPSDNACDQNPYSQNETASADWERGYLAGLLIGRKVKIMPSNVNQR